MTTAGENSSFEAFKMSRTWVLDLLRGNRQQVDAHGPIQMVLEEDMWLSEGKVSRDIAHARGYHKLICEFPSSLHDQCTTAL